MTPAPETAHVHHDIADRGDVARLVIAFYRDVAMDDLLGPTFAAARVDWPEHIEKLTDFWAGQLFGERGYEGNPLRAHEPVHARTPLRPEHYDQWLARFVDAVDASFTGPLAERAKQRARRMAKALARLLDVGHGDATVPVEVIVRRSA